MKNIFGRVVLGSSDGFIVIKVLYIMSSNDRYFHYRSMLVKKKDYLYIYVCVCYTNVSIMRIETYVM